MNPIVTERPMQLQSQTVILKAGTIVKHGTAAANLFSILELGIQPAFNRHRLRSTLENAPTANAVYVGGLAAYFGAWASASALIKEYELSEPKFTSIASSGERSALRAGDYSEPPFAVPVVLVIELAEDMELVADEDFALWKVGSDGSKALTQESTNAGIWARFMSGGLLRAGGIPASWIKGLEYPQLLRADHQNDLQFNRLLPDCHLLAAAVYQNHSIKPARHVSIGTELWHEEMSLSQFITFERNQLNKLMSLPALATKANRLHNIITQYSFVSTIGTQDYGITFS